MSDRLRKRLRDAVMACGGRIKTKKIYLEFERISDSPVAKMKDSDIKKYLSEMTTTSVGVRRLFVLAYLGLQICHDEILKLENHGGGMLGGDEK